MKIEKPTRIKRTYTQMLHAAPKDVFPLLCPVRELDWVDGWQLRSVASESGLVEQDCVFVTQSDKGCSTWVVNEYDPDRLYVEMIYITPGVTVCRLSIQLSEKTQNETQAQVTYMHTAIGDKGIEFIEQFTEVYYTNMMTGWEKTLNHYLKTGKKLDG